MGHYAILNLQLFDIDLTRKHGPLTDEHNPLYFRPVGDAGGGVFSARLRRLAEDGEELWEWQLRLGETGVFSAEFTLIEFAEQLSMGMALEMCAPATPIGQGEVLGLGNDTREAFLAWAHRPD